MEELLRSTDVVDVYICDVTELIKGDFISNNQIIIPFFKDTVKKGNSYIVCLDSESEDSIIYTLSSKNSVIDADNLVRVKCKVGR